MAKIGLLACALKNTRFFASSAVIGIEASLRGGHKTRETTIEEADTNAFETSEGRGKSRSCTATTARKDHNESSAGCRGVGGVHEVERKRLYGAHRHSMEKKKSHCYCTFLLH